MYWESKRKRIYSHHKRKIWKYSSWFFHFGFGCAEQNETDDDRKNVSPYSSTKDLLIVNKCISVHGKSRNAIRIETYRNQLTVNKIRESLHTIFTLSINKANSLHLPHNSLAPHRFICGCSKQWKGNAICANKGEVKEEEEDERTHTQKCLSLNGAARAIVRRVPVVVASTWQRKLNYIQCIMQRFRSVAWSFGLIFFIWRKI